MIHGDHSFDSSFQYPYRIYRNFQQEDRHHQVIMSSNEDNNKFEEKTTSPSASGVSIASLPADGPTYSRKFKKWKRDEINPRTISENNITFHLLTSQVGLKDSDEPTNFCKPSLILRYLDDDVMNWSKPWSCRSRGVTLPFSDLKLISQDNDRLLNSSVLHPDTHYVITHYLSL